MSTGSKDDPNCPEIDKPGRACKFDGALTFGVDYVTKLTDSGDGIMVIPIKPFEPGVTYLTALTDNIVMSDGRSLQPSSSYTLLSSSSPLVTPSQINLQEVINSYESIASEGTSKDRIIYTAAMTIQSVGAVMNTIKLLLLDKLKTQTAPALVVPDQDMVTVAQVLNPSDPNALAPFQAVQYLRGSIQLPMYSKEPLDKNISDLADTYWKAGCDNGALIAAIKEVNPDFTGLKAGKNDAICDAVSDGALRDFGLDQSRFLTKVNNVPNIERDATVPVQITKPIAQLLPGVDMPETGWPVVILQHGITTTKESLLGLTLALSNAGFATVAIDHPMHGERGLDIDDDGVDDFNATRGKGSVLSYMNFTSLLVARDNLRQSSADLLALRVGLNALVANPGLGINPTDVSYFGHSLGSIVGPNFVANANKPFSDAEKNKIFNGNSEDIARAQAAFKINAVGLASGGSGIVNFLIESGSFGAFVKGSVVAAAGNLTSKAFMAFVASDEIKNDCKIESELIECAYKLYEKQLMEAGDTATLASIQSILSQFSTVAQSALDSADPVNYAFTINALKTPTYLNVVTGGVAGNLPDAVIPPSTALPLSGTLPMAQLMGMTTATETQMGEPKNYVVKFSQGHHGSILTTDFISAVGGTAEGHAMTTAEMQTQLATFLATKGAMLPINNEAVIAN
jgi:Pla-1/cef family extracellular lipase